MALCPKCGSQVADGVKFCPSCGSAVGAAATGAAPAQPSQPGPATTGSSGGMAPNVAAMLTYLPLCLIGLVCAILFAFVLDPYKKDRFIRFHAWQSLALHVAFVAFSIVWAIFSFVITFIVHFFAVLLYPVGMLIGLGALVLMVFMMLKAYGNQTFKLPVIGDWAEKQSNT